MMTCPFCHGEMQRGVISGDGRTGVFWKAGERKASLVDQIVGIGAVKAAKRRLGAFTIDNACYCAACKKMIFDTEIRR